MYKRGIATRSIASIVLLILIVGFQSDQKGSLHFLQKEKHAVVSGQSITGMIAAAILAKSGYHVDTYEIRERYTRNIQWAARQSLVDELASIDQNLATHFLENVARPLYKGSVHISPNGDRRMKQHLGLREGNPLEVPKNGTKMMGYPSVLNMETKTFETFLKQYLQSMPNVHRHSGSIRLRRSGNSFCVAEQKTPDLIVIAEGANSATRKALGIGWEPVTQSRLQIAGAIGIDSGGVMIKHWRKEEGELRLTGVMGRKGSDNTWIVADVDPLKVTNQREIDGEFRRLAAAALEIPVEEIDRIKIWGCTDEEKIALFSLQQKISSEATIGDNVIFMGDSVGTGHWSVGGGMQVGAVCHAERLKTLLSDIDSGMPKNKALKTYSEGALMDTRAWGEAGLKDFYPTMQDLPAAVFDNH